LFQLLNFAHEAAPSKLRPDSFYPDSPFSAKTIVYTFIREHVTKVNSVVTVGFSFDENGQFQRRIDHGYLRVTQPQAPFEL
jgi:hypothetical protein